MGSQWRVLVLPWCAMTQRRGQGEGSIFREGNRWVAVLELPAGPGGKRVRPKRKVRTKAEAIEALRQLRAQAAAGIDASRVTVGAYLEDWLAHVLPARTTRGGRPIAVATVENYTVMVREHIAPALGRVRLDQLRPEHVDAMLRDMAAAGKARSTIRLARVVLAMALTHAERRNLVLRNAARLAVVPPAPVRRSRSLTLDQARELLAAARDDPLEAAWVTMLLLGLRPGECFALRWEDVDFSTGVLHVRQAIRRAGGARFEIGDVKTAYSARSVDMPGAVIDALGRQQLRQDADRLAADQAWEETGLVFTTAIGTMVDPGNARRSFRALIARAGLGEWHTHELRHSMVSLLSHAGVPVEVIADVVGHAPGSRITAEVYRHRLSPSAAAAKQTKGYPSDRTDHHILGCQ